MSSPLALTFKKPGENIGPDSIPIDQFSSYSFDTNILTPASAFRFTIPDLDKSTRMRIRSGDAIFINAVGEKGKLIQIATGFIDETDYHGSATASEYVITGRDILGQLVDNDSINITNTEVLRIEQLVEQLLFDTRLLNVGVIPVNTPNHTVQVNVNPGETKINTIQRYLEICNCLIWTQNDGQIIVGKPNMTQKPMGRLRASYSSPQDNNLLDFRAKRNINQAMRKIATKLQTKDQVKAGDYLIWNKAKDIYNLRGSKVGASKFKHFDYGSGNDAVNTVNIIGNMSGDDKQIGAQLSYREIARDNMKILEVECLVEGHLNENGIPYGVDQMYDVFIEDEDISEELYVYACSYDLTLEHGMMTRLRLCKKGTICAGVPII